MKKLIFTTPLVFLFLLNAIAQVGIGTASPNASSILDLSSTSKALVLPRMTTTQRDAIASPIPGMEIFNLTTNCVEIYRTGGWFNLCTDTNSGGTGTGSGPTSDSVATANLVAHWTFDNTKAEAKSGLSPTTTGTTVYDAAGKIGGALVFNGAYLVYPTIDSLNKPATFSNGFTLSMWAKLPVQPLYSSLWQLNGNIGDIFGLIGLSHRKAANDTLDFDGVMTNVDATGTHSTGFSTALEGGASGFKTASTEWAFIVMLYDTTSKTIKYYGNGILRGSKSIGNIIQPGSKFELVTTSSNPGITISQVSFGSLDVNPPFANAGQTPQAWQSPNLITGTEIDDTRLFNRALSATEITNLYSYGLAGK